MRALTVNRYAIRFVLKYRMFLPLIAGVALISSCEDVINVNLNNASPTLVVEGSIYDNGYTTQVVLSKTTDYFNPGDFSPLTNAEVSITDNAGNVYEPTDTINGAFIFGNLTGTPGITYTLKVIADGKEYTATSTMPQIVPIDSLVIDNNSEGPRENAILCYIKDPKGVQNYYQMRIWVNGDEVTSDNIILFSDKYWDGLVEPMRVDSRRAGIDRYLPTDTISVELAGIEKQTYDYLSTIRSITGQGRFLSTSTPANPYNNISNGAVGYFATRAVTKKTLLGK